MIDPSRPGKLTRRNLLVFGGGTALALICGAASRAAESFDRGRFIDLSAKLLQMDAGALDQEVAGKFLSNLIATGKEDALSALAGGAPELLLEQQIITGWYSGVQQTASGEEVVTYTEALIWDALDYTKPQGWCGGDTGYWALPPSED
jgi:hypothetical protein